MAKVNLKVLGYSKIYVSFNGTSVELVDGQEVDNVVAGDLISQYPQYFDGIEAPAPVEVKEVKEVKEVAPVTPVAPEIKEELLIEDSSIIEVTAEVAPEVSEIKEEKTYTNSYKKGK